MEPGPKIQPRSHPLFGREEDVQFLLDRAQTRGLTAVCGRGRQGKTWLLREVGTRLTDQGCLVGYHECHQDMGAILQAISALYLHWLNEANYADQFKLLWEKHKGNFITGVGAFILNAIKVDSLGDFPAEAAKALEKANQELRTGGIHVPITDYDTALKHMNIIGSLAQNRKQILILDAWEKAEQVDKEFAILKGFLDDNHLWPDCHIFIGVRQPNKVEGLLKVRAFECAEELDALPLGHLFELPRMHLEEEKEQRRLFKHLEIAQPGIGAIGRDFTLKQIDGYPGVLEQIFGSPDKSIQTKGDLIQKCREAQKQRWSELDSLLPTLTGDQLSVATRIALLPRFPLEFWVRVKDVILDTILETTWRTLSDRKVLSDDDFPTFGHDQRHEYARTVLIEKYRATAKQELKQLIDRLAASIQSTSFEGYPATVLLAGLKKSANALSITAEYQVLIDAALLVLGLPFRSDTLTEPVILNATKRNPSFSYPFALALFNRGVLKWESGDSAGGIADYDLMLAMADTPMKLKAMALINRGSTKGESGDSAGAMADYDLVLAMADAPAEEKARAQLNRGFGKEKSGDRAGAIADYDLVIAMADAPAEQKAMALLIRGFEKGTLGDSAGAIADYDLVIAMVDVPAEHRGYALFNRGDSKGALGDSVGAMADYDLVLAMPDAPAELKTWALVNRGLSKGALGDSAGAIADYDLVIAMVDVPADQKAKALANRGVALLEQGNVEGIISMLKAKDEFTRLGDMEKASKITAYLNSRDTG